MTRPVNALLNIIGGLLVGYGFASSCCFMGLQQYWISIAPTHPIASLGLVFRHNNHGSYTYFSHFQASACSMFSTSILFAFLGVLIAPRKIVKDRIPYDLGRNVRDRDEPSALMKRAALVGAAATPFLLYFAGPFAVERLSAAGLVG